MKSMVLLTVCLAISSPVWADNSLEPLLNKITLQLQSEQWVTTKTALVNVGVNASVADKGIEKIQTEVMSKLNQLSATNDWHLLSFDRQLDKSGLESIQIIAQARLAQTELANLRDKAKAMSKPGETFTIDGVYFTPSEDEIRIANAILRNNLYQQAKNEIDTLNKVYPEQKYYLHQIDFMMAAPMPMMQNETYAARAVSTVPKFAAPLSVGNKAQLYATVVLAATPDMLLQKLTPKA